MSIHQQIKQATAQVIVEGELLGTAWLCAPDLALTSAHVVGELPLQEIIDEQVTLIFPDSEVTATATMSDTDFHLDIALLRVQNPEAISTITPILIADSSSQVDTANQNWIAWGFPIGHSEGLFINGDIVSFDGEIDDAPAIQLRCNQSPQEALKNMSGSAVIMNGYAIGIVRKYTPNIANGAIFTSPLGENNLMLSELKTKLIQGRAALITHQLESQQPETTIKQTTVTATNGSIAIGGNNNGDINNA